ncbi:MAG: S24/S26 family peptidase [Clostridia bacterium]|nr:S24/S26 family peptidase [Clostridia bacterium]
MLRELVEQGHEVNLRIAGNSMLPFLLHQRDVVYVTQPDRPLKVGDIVFYQRQNGQFIMHRICRIRNDDYYTVGDDQQLIEGPLDREQIFGLVTKVCRKGKLIGPGSFWWEFFARVWIRMVPLRHFVMRVYGARSRRV